MPRITMYSRTMCGLCDHAREAILRLRSETAFAFEEIFVDDRPELELEYGLRVPVVLVDGEERFEGVVDPAALLEDLRTGA